MIPDVAGDPYALAATWIDCQQRLVVVVVDLSQVAELSRGEPPVWVQEPAVDRLVAALLDG